MSDPAKQIDGESGFFLLEAVIMMLLLSLLAFGLAQSTQLALLIRGKSARHATAMEIATDKMEELAGADPASLGEGSDSEETVLRNGKSFVCSVDVTVNEDQSRSITVEVRGLTERFGGSARVGTTLALWGSV